MMTNERRLGDDFVGTVDGLTDTVVVRIGAVPDPPVDHQIFNNLLDGRGDVVTSQFRRVQRCAPGDIDLRNVSQLFDARRVEETLEGGLTKRFIVVAAGAKSGNPLSEVSPIENALRRAFRRLVTRAVDVIDRRLTVKNVLPVARWTLKNNAEVVQQAGKKKISVRVQPEKFQSENEIDADGLRQTNERFVDLVVKHHFRQQSRTDQRCGLEKTQLIRHGALRKRTVRR